MTDRTSQDELIASVVNELDDQDAGASDQLMRGLQTLSALKSAFDQVGLSGQLPPDDGPSWRHLKLLETIGEGAFGTVYRAWDPVLRRNVALKLGKARAGDSLLIAEARRLARLRHPHILAVHGADFADEQVGIWSDLLQGATLESVVTQQSTIAHDAVLSMALSLSDALSLIHQRALVHGDIKPANIMVQPDGSPVLMDFGAARDALGEAQTAGSPLVMAPEQFVGEIAGPEADIYAFGAVLFRCFSGFYPLSADSLSALADRHAAGHRPDFSVLPRRWRSLIRAMLRPNPHSRPDAVEVHKRLQHMVGAGARLRRRVAVGAVIAALGGGLLMTQQSMRTSERARQQSDQVRDLVVGAVSESVQSIQSGPRSLETVFDNLSSRSEEALADYPLALADMRLVVGRGLSDLGQLERGAQLAERGMALLQTLPQATADDMSRGWMVVAGARKEMEDFEGAIAAVKKALAQLEVQPADDEVAMRGRFNALNHLALLMGQQGQWVEELSATRELLASRQAHYGEEALEVAVDHHNLSMALVQVGLVDEAIEHSRRCIGILAGHGLDDSFRDGLATMGLAKAQLASGNIDGATESLERATLRYQTHLPDGHGRLDSLALLSARLLLNQGALAEVEAIVTRLRSDEDLTLELSLDAQRLHIRLFEATARWADMARESDALLARFSPQLEPLRTYYQATLAVAQYRAGQQPTVLPTRAIQSAMDDLTQRGLTRLPAFADLERWQTEQWHGGDQQHGRGQSQVPQ